MSSNVIKVNLPTPSIELISTIQNYAESFVCDPDKKRWLDEFHSNQINSVLHHFDSPDFLTQLVRKEFQHIFPKHKIGGMLGLMKNSQHTPACLPPHCDRSRAVGLNYFITLGGDQVRTVFYDRVESIKGVATNIPYSEVNAIEQHVFEKSWYGYTVDRCHSVENIQTTRLFMAIRLVKLDLSADLDFEYSLADFIQDYPQLIMR